jgi:hypothetical protein
LPPLADAGFVEGGMGMPGLDAMLYPLRLSTSEGGYPETYASKTRYGFADADAELVLEAEYLDYAFCFENGIPVRLVASKPDTIEVIGLDGEVSLSIPAEPREYLGCHENAQILYYNSGEGIVDKRDSYDIETGELLKSEGGFEWGDAAHPPWPAEADPATGQPEPPAGFFYEAEGDAFALDATGKRAWLAASGAAVDVPEGYLAESAAGGFLKLVSKASLPPIILDSQGMLTEFSSLSELAVVSFDSGENFAVPYLQAESASHIGFIDVEGQWHYRQAKRLSLED